MKVNSEMPITPLPSDLLVIVRQAVSSSETSRFSLGVMFCDAAT